MEINKYGEIFTIFFLFFYKGAKCNMQSPLSVNSSSTWILTATTNNPPKKKKIRKQKKNKWKSMGWSSNYRIFWPGIIIRKNISIINLREASNKKKKKPFFFFFFFKIYHFLGLHWKISVVKNNKKIYLSIISNIITRISHYHSRGWARKIDTIRSVPWNHPSMIFSLSKFA